jgi:hypothetical protein
VHYKDVTIQREDLVDQLGQFAGASQPLRSDHADLGQVPTQAFSNSGHRRSIRLPPNRAIGRFHSLRAMAMAAK